MSPGAAGSPAARLIPSRRVELGPPTASAHLLTVLGEFVLPRGEPAWTAALLEAMGALGIEQKTARQALARATARGWLVNERVGRRARWQLTEHARRLLTEGAERIYTFGRRPHDWDGRWVLVVASVPEGRRDARQRLRVQMGWAGFGPVGAGVWLSPWAEREEEARRVLARLGLLGRAESFVGRLGTIGDGRRTVRSAWDLARIGAAYEEFIACHRPRRPAGGRDTFAALTALVHDWRRFPIIDPDLPVGLLPARWSGHRAWSLFHRLHGAWAPAARRWWEDRLEISANLSPDPRAL